eukprot:Blabericola_migrator_1__9393@NODE_5071_length_883_cov_110_974265_g3209_i0_p1_GENE_NODE_5071_length_883_cov_110_974265_g3209_i0NODE_5071_length_883_cov_110_974265_g3209_i0_p1_ORF_typecomplete_len253_score4_52Caps_synth_CapC/PF14102_6/1_3e04Caps_synth_CapC/PF14102_6/0_061Sugar_tr/PF00083_24/1_7DUF3278/PF11683_8/67DUF3278/PF11683_8/1_4DUF3278/PF11683_8/1_5e02Otopetrin/PF03189_13/0_87Otopetrin/PF03189_13/1_4e03Gaa1/PF04114_14/3_7Gaa1/PF04114_14/18_NODE_5071_length_883_cov_110_974265_g3209_i0105761
MTPSPYPPPSHFSRTQTVTFLIALSGVIILYLPAYIVLRAANRALLLICVNLVEAILLLIIACCLRCWGLTSCPYKNGNFTQAHLARRWLCILCTLGCFVLVWLFTIPSALCSCLETLKRHEAPAALSMGAAAISIPQLLVHVVSYSVAKHITEPNILCGASLYVIVVILGAMVSAMVAFFCTTNPNELDQISLPINANNPIQLASDPVWANEKKFMT